MNVTVFPLGGGSCESGKCQPFWLIPHYPRITDTRVREAWWTKCHKGGREGQKWVYSEGEEQGIILFCPPAEFLVLLGKDSCSNFTQFDCLTAVFYAQCYLAPKASSVPTFQKSQEVAGGGGVQVRDLPWAYLHLLCVCTSQALVWVTLAAITSV